MEKIKQIRTCYGCGVCAVSCPVGIIDIQLSEDGFYVPRIVDEKKCNGCEMCEKVCSYLAETIANEPNVIKGYVAYSKNGDTRKACSSGGIGFEIANKLLNDGYKASGVRYSVGKRRAEHFNAVNIEEFEESRGSKYLQSYTIDSFKEIDFDEKWVVFGTPCQVDSFSRLVSLKNKKDNFILIDFFCHGVPSYFLWEQYMEYMKEKQNFENIISISFRNKSNVDRKEPYTISLKTKSGDFFSSRIRDKDLFYQFFLGNCCLNKPCYQECKYKGTNSSADIRIGDLWSKKYSEREKGLSAVLSNSDRGNEVIADLKDCCNVRDEQIDVVCDGQMKNKLKKPLMREKVVSDLSKGKSLVRVNQYVTVVRKVTSLLRRLKFIRG